jgi:hypothetical protein
MLEMVSIRPEWWTLAPVTGFGKCTHTVMVVGGPRGIPHPLQFRRPLRFRGGVRSARP